MRINKDVLDIQDNFEYILSILSILVEKV